MEETVREPAVTVRRWTTSTPISACAIADDDELPPDDLLCTANVAHGGRFVGLKNKRMYRCLSNTGVLRAPMVVAARLLTVVAIRVVVAITPTHPREASNES